MNINRYLRGYKKIGIKIQLLFILCLIIVSCEHGGNYDYIIDNKTNHKIKIHFTPKLQNHIQIDTTFIINETTKTTFFRWESINAGSFQQRYLPFKISTFSPIEDTLVVSRDWNLIDNWVFITNGKTWEPESSFTFSIDEKDIKKKVLVP